MKITTTRFGEINVAEELVFTFESPIIGYDELSKFLLIEHDEKSCFKWLQSTEAGEVAFPVTSTTYFNIEYNIDISDEDAEKIGLTSAESLIVLNIATIPHNRPQSTTVNLKAPIIMNIENRKAMQVILPDDRYKIRHPLFAQQDTEKKDS